jgi:amino acid transporter
MSMSRDGLMPKRFGKIHPRFQTPGFSTIVTGIIVAIPSLFVESAIMTDLTSIGTLFAFVLVCGGVLMLPRAEKSAEKKFNLPYINAQWIVLALFFVFLYGFRERLGDAIVNIVDDTREQILFLLFVIMFAAITIFSFTKKLSLIPVLGMICCLYLMIEIPTSSWIVFFGWMAFGLVIYFLYGYWKSKLSLKFKV